MDRQPDATSSEDPMRWVRNDVSSVAPQGGYVAKRCPVRAQWDVLRPAEQLAVPESALRRMAAGVAFEADVFERLRELHPHAVVIERGAPGDRADRERRTVAAMESGAPLILGGRLPADQSARRVGEPDVLLAHPDGGYSPIDVKHHQTLTSGSGIPAVVAGLAGMSFGQGAPPPDKTAAKSKDDLLQLAHYRRMLEACGHAAPDSMAAIIGSELLATWFDLSEPIWRTPSLSQVTKLRSTVDVYDFEFAFRLDIIEVAQRHATDPSVELLVVPVRTGECASCPWWGHCEQLLTEVSDVSLLPYSSWQMWSTHRDRGVHTLSDLASLDWRTADLLARKVDLAHLFEQLDTGADRLPGATPIGDVIGRAKRGQIAKLHEAGVTTAADARALDRRVGAYSARSAPTDPTSRSAHTTPSVRDLPGSIDMARARLVGALPFLARGLDRVDVLRGDIEVDLDLENSDDGGVYLWGALVTDRAGCGLVDQGYRSFVTWDADLAHGELVVFDELCSWVEALLSTATRNGLALTAYCYNEKAEARALRRLAGAASDDPGRARFIEDLVTSSSWVDLLEVCRTSLVTGRPMGLKHMAALAGFRWEDPDPGGEQSMTWYHQAVNDDDAAVRARNRRRILTYNRNDVEATLALREWLDTQGSALASISSLD